MPQTTYGRRFEVRTVLTTVDGSGNGTLAVVFEAGLFAATPEIKVVKHPANSGTFQVKVSPAASKDGFTIEVLTSSLVSQQIPVSFMALEKA